LYKFIHSTAVISWNLRVNLASDIAEGLSFIHNHTPAIVHRDLKSPNVLLTVADNCVTAKLGDIGMARPIGIISRAFRTRTGLDNPIWLAPEVIGYHRYGAEADIYAMGVILWELLSRKDFFGEFEFMYLLEKKVTTGERPDIPDCPSQYKDLIKACWGGDPEARPKAEQCVVNLKDIKEQLKLGPRESLKDDEVQALYDAISELEEISSTGSNKNSPINTFLATQQSNQSESPSRDDALRKEKKLHKRHKDKSRERGSKGDGGSSGNGSFDNARNNNTK